MDDNSHLEQQHICKWGGMYTPDQIIPFFFPCYDFKTNIFVLYEVEWDVFLHEKLIKRASGHGFSLVSFSCFFEKHTI